MKTGIIASLSAASLAIAPVAGHAADASVSRQSTPESDASELGGSSLFFLGAIVAVAVGIFLLIDDDDAVSA